MALAGAGWVAAGSVDAVHFLEDALVFRLGLELQPGDGAVALAMLALDGGDRCVSSVEFLESPCAVGAQSGVQVEEGCGVIGEVVVAREVTVDGTGGVAGGWRRQLESNIGDGGEEGRAVGRHASNVEEGSDGTDCDRDGSRVA